MSVVDRVPISYRRVSNLAHAEQYVYGEVSRNAFEYYLERGSIDGFAVDDWLRAERSILIKPDVTLKRFNQDFFIEVLLPGACPEDEAEAECQHHHGELWLADHASQYDGIEGEAERGGDGNRQHRADPIVQAEMHDEGVSEEAAQHHDVALGEVDHLGRLVDQDESERD